ncbi:MAG: redox-regulated ATPase YchF [archaeon]
MLIGLVGKPNVGKSTFFKAATLAEVLIADYPFATIKPNHGMGYVKVDCIDKELGVQCMPRIGFCINHKRFVAVELMDVAGLVPGASKGKGLGNQFLDDLRQADAFIQIVDLSGTTDVEGKKTQGYNPVNDIIFLEEELDLWFLGILNKVWKAFSRTVDMQHQNAVQAIAKQFSGLKISENLVKTVFSKVNFSERLTSWSEENIARFAHELRALSKPMIIAANKCDTAMAVENLKKIKEKFPDKIIIPCSAEAELALREAARDNLIDYVPGDSSFKIKGTISEKQQKALEFIKNNILDANSSTGVQEILNKTVFQLLDYIAIFPAGATKLADSKGNILPDCFLLPNGSTALDFAYAVHTDLGKKFIRAIDAKTKLAVGKEHKLKHRDGIEIVT